MLNSEQLQTLENLTGNHREGEFKSLLADDKKFFNLVEFIHRHPLEGKTKFRIFRNLATLFEEGRSRL